MLAAADTSSGMSVEDVPAGAKIKTLKKRLIAHKFATRWFVGVVRSLETKKRVAGQFAVKYKKEASCWTHSLNKEDYGVDKYFLLRSEQKK